MSTLSSASVLGLPLLSFRDKSIRSIPSGTFKSSSFNLHRRNHLYYIKSDEERLLGCVIRLRAIKCFDPASAKKCFAGHLEKCENVALKVVECCNNQTKVGANLSSSWLPQWKNFDKTFDERELLINGIYFVPCASRIKAASWVCFAKGQRPRKPRIWKTRTRIGTVSKSEKLVQHIKALSNVKEEVYAALDSFIAWEVEFPLITVKKALKTLQAEKEWKRIIQITKWMLSKGQGKTMGNYYLLLDALAQEQRTEEAEEFWNQIFKRHLEYVPRMFFTRVITMYEQNNMPDKLLEVFADMEELGVKPDHLSISIVASTFKNLGMLDKYEKVLKKYPETEWKDFYHNGKPYRVQAHKPQNYGQATVEQNHNSSNGTEGDESPTDDFRTAEDREWQDEMPESLDKRDRTRMLISN